MDSGEKREWDGNDETVTRRQVLSVAAVGGLSLGSYTPGYRSQRNAPPAKSGRLTEYIGFDHERSLEAFDDIDYRNHVELVQGETRDGLSLLVQIPAGDHNGASLSYLLAEDREDQPEGLWATFYMYFPPTFVIDDDTGKLPGPAGRYDSAGWGNRPSDGTNGWSARMGFFHEHEHEHEHDDGGEIGLSYYVYHADMENVYGDIIEWDRPISTGDWHRIDQFIELNTPGSNDGVLRGWADGDQLFERTDFRFRDTDELKIEEFWFDIYWGGEETSPDDNAIVFDDLSLIRHS